MKKNFNQAPLPFMGQKRRFVREFKEALKHFSDASVFVDLFGGSGLLSHIAKSVRPDATVVYNDYDGYHKRIDNIARTNQLISDIRNIAAKLPKEKKIDDPHRKAILDRIKSESGFVDYITLSSSLLFSMNYVTSYDELSKQTFYNAIKQSDYDAAGYLDELEIVRMDYADLFQHWMQHPSVVFLVDPPYLSTEVGSYNCYWRLGNYLDVLQTVRGVSYFYFTSNKSSILELCEWIEKNLGADNPFNGAKKVNIESSIGYNSKYTDIMLFKHC
jgi:16S rRNA G966 N2-methylase RsmD